MPSRATRALPGSPPPLGTPPDKGELTPAGVVQPVAVAHPVGELHLEVHEAKNQLLVVGADDTILRQIPVAGNPSVQKPPLSYVGDRIPESADYDYEWRLPHFVRLIDGRGVGTHAIPLAVADGSPAQQASELGLDVGEAPLSHGCLRMTDQNARWVYDTIPAGTPVYWL